jgi:thiol-disulfide isomerase/thioredoxin
MLDGQSFDNPDDVLSTRQSRRPRMGAGWVVLLVALAAGVVWGARRFGGPGAAVAAGPGKPVMLMFTADWCGPCQAFKARVLSDPAVLDRLGRDCRFQTIDLTNWAGRNKDVAKHYGVEGIPTLMLVDGDGAEISRYNGPHDAQYFARWMDQNTK